MAGNMESGGMAPVKPSSTNALISLIAGILGVTFFPIIGSIIAVVVGRSAKNEIAGSGGALGGEGLAQIGVILGWVGIGLGVLGVCVVCAVFVLPFALGGLGILSNGFSGLLPVLGALI